MYTYDSYLSHTFIHCRHDYIENYSYNLMYIFNEHVVWKQVVFLVRNVQFSKLYSLHMIVQVQKDWWYTYTYMYFTSSSFLTNNMHSKWASAVSTSVGIVLIKTNSTCYKMIIQFIHTHIYIHIHMCIVSTSGGWKNMCIQV